ncbi:MAG TPA: type IV toxin-antitoxin system AbiEi family antitoxin domain-containing protein [Dermatophilaceae bacterium]|nr:type IV toxin-antitoxin system AbiEi family antitoxin domain-containing protein [Dermatophilaceae bacterium]
MDPALLDLARSLGGVFSASDAARVGTPPRRLRTLTDRGELVRVRARAYVLAEWWRAAAPHERYRLEVLAVCRRRSGSAASHHAGLAVHRLPLVDVDLRHIDLAADVVHASGVIGVRVHPRPPGDRQVDVGGTRACSAATCIVQVAATTGLRAGVVAADTALHRGWADPPALHRAAATVAPRYGASAVAGLLDLADGRSESPGESLTRLVLRGAGLDAAPQVRIRERGGRVVARVDLLVHGVVVVEFDGAVKYDGAGGREALVREKRREDHLRRLGFEVVRLTWADLQDPARVVGWVREALARAAARRPERRG